MSTLYPQTDIALRDGRNVTVKELCWGDAMELFRRLQAHAGKLIDPQGRIILDADHLAGIIAGIDDLSGFLLSKATSLPVDQIQALPLRDGLRVLEEAIALTLNEEVVAQGKKVAGRVKAAFGIETMTKTASPPSATS